VNALELKFMLSGKRVLAPPTLIKQYPELREIADPAPSLPGSPDNLFSALYGDA
jgi:hypothetical protein